MTIKEEQDRHTLKIKRFRIYENIIGGAGQVVFAYPHFTSIEEALKYIHTVLDPYYTGRYGVVERP